ncbi:lipid II flippase MurJ [Erwiniaceae bacterium L1_54_6]|nr:lipid II flippase MurJ [Erwiniaceae bacterium L1_54_6]
MKKAIISLISGNLASKFLGLAREMIVAALFGTGYVNGAYRVAQTGTLVPVNFLVSDSLTAFIPLFKKFRSEDKDKAILFFWVMQAIFLIFSALLTVGAYLFVEQWINIIAPGLDQKTKSLSESMLLIMSLGISLYLSSALINYIEMANDDFTPMSLRPSIQNIGMLIGALFAYYLHNPLYLAWGFTIGYVFFFIWVLLRGLKARLITMPKAATMASVKEIISCFWETIKPLIILPFAYQGNIAAERAVATLISLTAISALDYAKFINETLLLIVSTPVALAGLVNWAGDSKEVLTAKLKKAMKTMLIISVPISIFIYLNSEMIVSILFARGKFDQISIDSTANILRGMSIGLWANVVGYVLVKALTSQFKNRIVLIVMLCCIACNASFNLIFFKHYNEMTLGLGNSLYGVVMLILALSFLNLWGGVIELAASIILTSLIYIALTLLIDSHTSIRMSFFINSVFFIFFWTGCVLLIPSWRNLIVNAVNRNGKKEV